MSWRRTPKQYAAYKRSQDERRALRKAHDLCRSCGNPALGHCECKPCRKKRNYVRQKGHQVLALKIVKVTPAKIDKVAVMLSLAARIGGGKRNEG